MSALFDKLFKTSTYEKQRFGKLYQSFLKSKRRSKFQMYHTVRIKSTTPLVDKSKFLYDIPDSMIFPNTTVIDETEENADVFLREFGELLDTNYYLPESVLHMLGLSHLIEDINEEIIGEEKNPDVFGTSSETSSQISKKNDDTNSQAVNVPLNGPSDEKEMHTVCTESSSSSIGFGLQHIMGQNNVLKKKHNCDQKEETFVPSIKDTYENKSFIKPKTKVANNPNCEVGCKISNSNASESSDELEVMYFQTIKSSLPKKIKRTKTKNVKPNMESRTIDTTSTVINKMHDPNSRKRKYGPPFISSSCANESNTSICSSQTNADISSYDLNKPLVNTFVRKEVCTSTLNPSPVSDKCTSPPSKKSKPSSDGPSIKKGVENPTFNISALAKETLNKKASNIISTKNPYTIPKIGEKSLQTVTKSSRDKGKKHKTYDEVKLLQSERKLKRAQNENFNSNAKRSQEPEPFSLINNDLLVSTNNDSATMVPMIISYPLGAHSLDSDYSTLSPHNLTPTENSKLSTQNESKNSTVEKNNTVSCSPDPKSEILIQKQTELEFEIKSEPSECSNSTESTTLNITSSTSDSITRPLIFLKDPSLLLKEPRKTPFEKNNDKSLLLNESNNCPKNDSSLLVQASDCLGEKTNKELITLNPLLKSADDTSTNDESISLKDPSLLVRPPGKCLPRVINRTCHGIEKSLNREDSKKSGEGTHSPITAPPYRSESNEKVRYPTIPTSPITTGGKIRQPLGDSRSKTKGKNNNIRGIRNDKPSGMNIRSEKNGSGDDRLVNSYGRTNKRNVCKGDSGISSTSDSGITSNKSNSLRYCKNNSRLIDSSPESSSDTSSTRNLSETSDKNNSSGGTLGIRNGTICIINKNSKASNDHLTNNVAPDIGNGTLGIKDGKICIIKDKDHSDVSIDNLRKDSDNTKSTTRELEKCRNDFDSVNRDKCTIELGKQNDILSKTLQLNEELMKSLTTQKIYLGKLIESSRACEKCEKINEILFLPGISPEQKISILQNIHTKNSMCRNN